VQRAQATIRDHSGVRDFTPHDIRRTVATFLTSELGVPRLVVSKILNHVEHGVTKVYDRASYDQDKRLALERWAVRLNEMLTRDSPTVATGVKRSRAKSLVRNAS
jgi:integrase